MVLRLLSVATCVTWRAAAQAFDTIHLRRKDDMQRELESKFPAMKAKLKTTKTKTPPSSTTAIAKGKALAPSSRVKARLLAEDCPRP